MLYLEMRQLSWLKSGILYIIDALLIYMTCAEATANTFFRLRQGRKTGLFRLSAGQKNRSVSFDCPA
jgi:hypothetical protein